ncbi:MAG TPA: nuclear transport factor 2 family protein [Pseudonocardia sp.]|nr:nuclear transport factor 2 family protein [Pseudonocardia sp.]
MTDDALAVLKGMYAAEQEYLDAGGPARANFATLAPFFAPDVVLHQAEGLPYGGTWRGHAGMERFFVAMSTAWESFAMREQEFHPSGDVVVVRTQVRATPRGSGRELEFPILQTVRVVDGRIAEIWPFYWDTDAVATAFRALTEV